MQHSLHFKRPKFEKSMLKLGRPVRTVSMLFLLYVIGWGMALPYIPVYLKTLFDEYAIIGLIISLQHVFGLIFALFLGPALDKINKKELISLILLFYLPFSRILLALRSVWEFVIFRIYHSVLSTSLWLTSDAYLRAHTHKGKEAQTMGLFHFCAGLAFVIGGLLGALFIREMGFKVLWGITFFAALALIYSFRLPDHTKRPLLKGLKSSLHINNLKREWRDYRRDERLYKLTLYVFPFFFATEFLMMTIPLVLQDLGAELWLVGVVFAAYHLPTLFQSYFASTKNHVRTATLGLVFATIIFLALFFCENLSEIFFLTLLLGIAISAINPILLGRFTPLMPRR